MTILLTRGGGEHMIGPCKTI